MTFTLLDLDQWQPDAFEARALKCLKGTSKNQDFFCEGKEVVRGKSECMGEYMRAHGAKSTKFVCAGGCKHATDAAITEKDGF